MSAGRKERNMRTTARLLAGAALVAGGLLSGALTANAGEPPTDSDGTRVTAADPGGDTDGTRVTGDRDM
jgi:hypothetical protein